MSSRDEHHARRSSQERHSNHFHRDRDSSFERRRSLDDRNRKQKRSSQGRSTERQRQRPDNHNDDRNKHRNRNRSSPSSSSHHSTRTSNRYARSGQRRRPRKTTRSSYDDSSSGDNDRRKRRRRQRSPEKQKHRSPSPRRRGSMAPPLQRQHQHQHRQHCQRRDSDESQSPNRESDRGLRQRRRGHSNNNNHSNNSMGGASSKQSLETARRGRRRRRRPLRRSRRGARSSASSEASPRHAPADVPPRAGVVSDDDDNSTPHNHAKQQQTENNNNNSRNNKATATPTSAAKTKRSSASSSHDDTIGHFKGREGDVIADRYKIIQEVGVGTFGRVLECLDLKKRRDRRDNVVAIKIVRNIKRYHESALIEADIVDDVNRRGGRGVSHCALMYDAFSFSGHYSMVFESLGPSLYDFLKRQKYQPFPIACVRDFAKQLLETLEFLHSFRLIHTDLKPENVLLLNGREVSYKGYSIPECTRIKVIDFGGATYDNEKKSSVVNTRQYRAPEVILGVGWSMPSDLWSVGCILAELYQGELLFATHDNIEHLALIEQVIGPFPRRMLKRAKNAQLANEAFDSAGAHRMERVLPPESLAYVKRIGPLESLVFEEDTWFLRLLRRILVTDPDERATARECLRKF